MIWKLFPDPGPAHSFYFSCFAVPANLVIYAWEPKAGDDDHDDAIQCYLTTTMGRLNLRNRIGPPLFSPDLVMVT